MDPAHLVPENWPFRGEGGQVEVGGHPCERAQPSDVVATFMGQAPCCDIPPIDELAPASCAMALSVRPLARLCQLRRIPMRVARIALLTSLTLPLTYTVSASAARDDDSGSSESESSDGDEAPGKTEGADVRVEGSDGSKESVKELDPGEIERAKKAEEASSPAEKPSKTYYFVGARYRGMIVPKFMMTLFGDGGRGLYLNGFGPEFTVRKDNFEYVLSAWFVDYKMPYTRFKAKDDPATSWEMVKSTMKALYLTSDFNWTSQINPVFGLNFGIGAGIGVLWGNINRNEAYKGTDGNWHRCAGPNNPDSYYCGSGEDEQYNYKEPDFASGGAKPFIFPWLAVQTGARIKPHRNFMMRLDVGWAITGPFFGFSGNYGI